MLSEHTPMTTLATADQQRSRDFYEGVLGFTAEDAPDGGGLIYQSGDSSFLVYPSSFAGTNQATAMSFQVPFDRFDDELAVLRTAGITFDEFEWEGVEWVDGVAVMDGMKAAWFTDPDGNILNVESMLQ